MKTYKTLEIYNTSQSLQIARRFTEEEKSHYAEWFKDFGFVGIPGTCIELDYIHTYDNDDVFGRIIKRKCDGEFLGCSNQAYIVSDEEWDYIVALNEANRAKQLEKERKEGLEYYEHVLAQCERQSKLYTKAEAAARAREYNNLYNEGGEGYVPHFWTIDEYNYAKQKIEELS